MATNIFQQYGIKEVADVILYDSTGTPVMYFDTLKVSNIEETAETTDARGGKGNPKLISWDYGKEITVTLQDALMSMKSLELLTSHEDDVIDHTVAKNIRKAELVTLGDSSTFVPKYTPASTTGVYILEAAGTALKGTTYYSITTGGSSGDVVRAVYNVSTTGVYEIVISPNRFPGTYTLIGDTVIRNKKTGLDEGFQFIIPKAKISSEVTLSMEAEGDPTVFDMTITVLKAENGTMMSLVKYDIGEPTVDISSNLT